MTSTAFTPSSSHAASLETDRKRENDRKLMEDLADLNVLEDTLSKSLQLSSTMVDLLHSFDDRLKGFEVSILPIYRSTQRLNRYYDNLERTLVAANRVIEYYDLADVERVRIANGPDESNLIPYLESLGRITHALKYLTDSKFTSGEKAIYKLRQQQNAGVMQLLSVYKKWLIAISSPPELSTWIREGVSDIPDPPAADVKRISDLASWLTTTSECTPLSESNANTVADATPAYVQVRSAYIQKALSPLFSSASDARSRLEAKASASFIQLTIWLAAFIRSEQRLMQSVFSRSSPQQRADILDQVVTPAVIAYLSTGSNLLVPVKRSNGRSDLGLVFVLFDVLEFWNKQRDELSAVLDGLAKKTWERIEAMFDQWTTASLRVIPDFLDEIKQAPRGNVTPDGTVHELTSNCISFMKRLLEYPDSTESILLSIGEGEWDSVNVTQVRVQYVKSSSVLTRKYLVRALGLLDSTLEAKARTYKKSALAILFQANNTHYILKNVKSGKLGAVLGGEMTAKYERDLKRHRDQFVDQFKPLNGLLMDVTVIQNNAIRRDMSASERTGVKDKFIKYNTMLEDTVKNFRGCAVADGDLRAQLVKDAQAYLLPMYERFAVKHQTSDFSKHKERYIKYDGKQIAQMMERMFLNS